MTLGAALTWTAARLTALGLGLLAVTTLLHRTRSRRATTRAQQIALGADHALHIVDVNGRRLVVGTGPGSAPRLLTELEVDAPSPGWAPRPCEERESG